MIRAAVKSRVLGCAYPGLFNPVPSTFLDGTLSGDVRGEHGPYEWMLDRKHCPKQGYCGQSPYPYQKIQPVTELPTGFVRSFETGRSTGAHSGQRPQHANVN